MSLTASQCLQRTSGYRPRTLVSYRSSAFRRDSPRVEPRPPADTPRLSVISVTHGPPKNAAGETGSRYVLTFAMVTLLIVELLPADSLAAIK